MSKRLAGKSALVTGGGTGIGLGVALALAHEGCRVAIAGRRREPLEAACQQYTGSPAMSCHPVDVGDLASVETLFRWSMATLGPLDILVNSAGVNVRNRTMAELDPADWDKMMRINASGAFYCMRGAARDAQAAQRLDREYFLDRRHSLVAVGGRRLHGLEIRDDRAGNDRGAQKKRHTTFASRMFIPARSRRRSWTIARCRSAPNIAPDFAAR